MWARAAGPGHRPGGAQGPAGQPDAGPGDATSLADLAASDGVGVAWVLPVETILGAISSSMADILPGQLLSPIASGSASGADVLVACTYAAVAATAAALAFARRDVAA